MPDKHLTIATYAAGASLAAITLIYVFAPTYFIDEQSAAASATTRKKGVVGLYNPANDCFINSVLQALAGLGDLRVHLIRETHRRTLDDVEIYTESPENHSSKSSPSWKIEGLQQGLVSQGLKEILDALNERPIYKKTISATGFVQVLEKAFRQRISRQQQDAQEFLQVVVERLNDEYHAGHMARQRARARLTNGHSAGASADKIKPAPSTNGVPKPPLSELPTIEHREDLVEDQEAPEIEEIVEKPWDEEDGFPLEGTTESQIECTTCGFKPKPSEMTFLSLGLNVPQVQTTTLGACFDGYFKTEEIDDFKCEKCRLIHAVEHFQSEIKKSNSEKYKLEASAAIQKLLNAIDTDPEMPPKDIELPDSKYAPKRKIKRHIRITKFPKVLALHLSRSIFDPGQSSMKNSAKVTFPEILPLGGVLNRVYYKLSAVTTHKGSHQSGHYETFRRQSTFPAFSTPNAINPNGAYGYNKTATGSPQLSASVASASVSIMKENESQKNGDDATNASSTPEEATSPTSMTSRDSTPDPKGPAGRLSTDSHRSALLKRFSNRQKRNSASISTSQDPTTPSTSTPDPNAETSSISSSIRRTISKVTSTHKKDKDGTGEASKGKSRRERKKSRRQSERWWRISDERIKESKTNEVLGMQKEVYLLFYELER